MHSCMHPSPCLSSMPSYVNQVSPFCGAAAKCARITFRANGNGIRNGTYACNDDVDVMTMMMMCCLAVCPWTSEGKETPHTCSAAYQLIVFISQSCCTHVHINSSYCIVCIVRIVIHYIMRTDDDGAHTMRERLHLMLIFFFSKRCGRCDLHFRTIHWVVTFVTRPLSVKHARS